MTTQLIPLVDAVAALRSELNRAQAQSSQEEIQFEVGPVEITFQVVATSETSMEGKASIGFQILGLGAQASAGDKASDAITHTIKITLTPRKDGLALEISDVERDLEGASGR